MAANASEFLLGSRVKSASFPTKGTKVEGVIAREPQMQQQRDIDGKPESWDNGDPKMQLKVVLATDQRDDADDNGERALYVKTGLRTAVADAMREANISQLAVGDRLAVEYVGDGEAKRGRTAPKQYRVTVTPGSADEPPASGNDGVPF